MLSDRRVPPRGLRAANPAVSMATEAIVRHCLEPDPARRYQTVRDLQEDLDRHLHDLPLKHTPEPSLAERGRKWVRRHPRLTSTTSVAVILGAVLLLAAFIVHRGQTLARQGKRALALADAREALLLDPTPEMKYQVAGIYALTSKQNAEDKLQALHLLSSALRAGAGLEWVDDDHDLDPLRGDAEFKRIVAAAKALQGRPR
jgi:hypothetical protein